MEPRQKLFHVRIAQRFDAMLACRIVDMPKRCVATCHPDLPTCAGAGTGSPGSILNEPPTASDCASAASLPLRQLAKRQLTWLRSMLQRQVVPPVTRPTRYSQLRRRGGQRMSLSSPAWAKPGGDAVPVFANVVHRGAREFVAIVGENRRYNPANRMAGLDRAERHRCCWMAPISARQRRKQAALLRRDKVGCPGFHVLPHLDVAQNVAPPLLGAAFKPDAHSAYMQMLQAVA